MNKDATDHKIFELIKSEENISPLEISRKLGITEVEVVRRVQALSDSRNKILIVDDEMDTLLPLKISLEASNYNVIEAHDGPKAIELAKTEFPDLILLDLMMPGMDGYEVCSRLKKESLTEHIPIIMLTAKDEIRDKLEGFEIGADDYVTKPFNLSELKARINSMLRRLK
ncbi:MAG: response regulator [Candidatus Methanoperedens sp.]|nr:response regulator [Candidatus Methanoperedens sp.]MCE8428804.1 response regulator [Candidatus Methanoperedens sp.]